MPRRTPSLSFWWVYAAMTVSVAQYFLVLDDPQEAPLRFLRLVFGIGLLGFVPGYLTLRTAFPQTGLAVLEQVVLSVFLSILISVSLGVILGAVSLFQSNSNALLLSSYTVASAVAAAYRATSMKPSQQP